jgi:hypothetical protein
MAEEDVKAAMAKKLVLAMEPEKAQGVLLKILDGGDLYDAILGADDETKPEPPVKKRRTRKRKALGSNLADLPGQSLMA